MTPEFLFAKITDIGLVTVYYFLIGVVLSGIIDRTLGKFDQTQYKDVSTIQLTVEICGHLFLLGILAYMLRNIIGMIPFPLEGLGGFRHAQLKEIDGGIILSFILIFFQSNLNDKITYFNRRVIQGETI
jgi:hypothetical protein